MINSSRSLSPMIIDNGSGYIKAGLADEQIPKAHFPTLVAKEPPKSSFLGFFGLDKLIKTSDDIKEKTTFVGYEAFNQSIPVNISKPIENGLIVDFEGIESVWHHCYYNEIKVKPESHPLILTENPLNTQKNRARMVEIAFETLNVPALMIANQGVLAIYASGKTTGIVLDSGDAVTYALPVFEGRSINQFLKQINLGGKDLEGSVLEIIKANGMYKDTFENIETMRSIKGNICCIAMDYETAIINEDSSELPDGKAILLKEGHFAVAEALFQPSLIKKDLPGVHEILFQSVSSCEEGIRKKMINNVVLAGGSMMFKGIEDRMMKEINVFKSQMNLQGEWNIAKTANREFSSWLGGGVAGVLSINKELWMNKQEYDEFGPQITNIKHL